MRTLFAGTGGDVWIGVTAPEGLQRLHEESLRTYPLPESASSQRIRVILEAKGGTTWIGTSGGQLLKVEGDRLINWTEAARERFASIRCMTATEDGSLWIGFAGSGLARLKDGRLARITTREGLEEDYISQVAVDSGGRFWSAGARGLFQIQLDQLVAVAEGRAKRLHLRWQLDGIGGYFLQRAEAQQASNDRAVDVFRWPSRCWGFPRRAPCR